MDNQENKLKTKKQNTLEKQAMVNRIYIFLINKTLPTNKKNKNKNAFLKNKI